jgi:hypothetical protein
MATQKEIKLCQEITALAIRINAQSSFSVWAEFSGHVNGFEVRVTEKWKSGVNDIEGWGCSDRTVYLSSDREPSFFESIEDIAANKVAELQELKADLSKFLGRSPKAKSPASGRRFPLSN